MKNTARGKEELKIGKQRWHIIWETQFQEDVDCRINKVQGAEMVYDS